MYSIQLKPVYSCPASDVPAELSLPQGWKLSWHQLEAWKALRDPNIDVIFNTAMTGDGKSLAAYLPAMTGKSYTMAMYPTNELARDQERQVRQYKADFDPKDYDPQIFRLTGATLENFVETHQLPSKQQGILDRSENSEILLTNPDIFHYIHDFRYLRRNPKKPGKGDNPDKLFRKIDESYKIFLFDEFHIFSSPQIASVLNALLLIKHTSSSGRKFLFLSATPSELLTGFLNRSSFKDKVKIIDPVKEKKYRFSSGGTTGWRQISQPISLYFPADLQPNSKSGYDWIFENAEQVILQFFLDYPGSQGAIILNSIASVYKLIAVLKPLFEKHGLTILPNTSLTGESERARSVSDADLLIGTSTIDVGVDFRINFLVFEAADAGNFIQRFGRLGRHKGFDIYQAYALIPNYLVARLFEGHQGKSAVLMNDEAYDRVFFTEAVHKAWTRINEFKDYPKRWGVIQSYFVWNELRRPQMKSAYPNAEQDFKHDVQNSFQIKSLNTKYGVIQHYIETKQHKIIDEARSFRGSSQLDCAVYDVTNPDEPERDRFKTYNLPGLLSNFVFEAMKKSQFLAAAKQAGIPIQRFENYALCYLRLLDYREVRESWHFYYADENLDEIKRSGRVQCLKHLNIEGIDLSYEIRNTFYNKNLVCYVSDHRRDYLRAKLGLPMQFQAYGLSDRPDDRDPPYTIAFGQAALMLETLIWHWKDKAGEGWIC